MKLAPAIARRYRRRRLMANRWSDGIYQQQQHPSPHPSSRVVLRRSIQPQTNFTLIEMTACPAVIPHPPIHLPIPHPPFLCSECTHSKTREISVETSIYRKSMVFRIGMRGTHIRLVIILHMVGLWNSTAMTESMVTSTADS